MTTTLTLLLNFGVVDVCDEFGALFESSTYVRTCVRKSQHLLKCLSFAKKHECAADCTYE